MYRRRWDEYPRRWNEWAKIAEAEEYSGKSQNTLRKWAKRGYIRRRKGSASSADYHLPSIRYFLDQLEDERWITA